jgi:hypothetical protein
MWSVTIFFGSYFGIASWFSSVGGIISILRVFFSSLRDLILFLFLLSQCSKTFLKFRFLILHKLFMLEFNLELSLLSLNFIESLLCILLNVLVRVNNFKLKFLVLLGEIVVFLTKAVELSVDFFAFFGITIFILIFRHKLFKNSALLKEVFHILDFLGVTSLGFDGGVIIITA